MENDETTAREKKSDREQGTVTVIVALAFVALLLFGALAIDVGAVYSSRTQSQNAADSAALAAASRMIQQSGTNPATVDLPGARTEGGVFAGSNATVGVGSVNVDTAPSGDFEFGNWDLDTRTLDTGVDLTKPSQVTGVRVTVRMDDNANSKSPAFISRLLGRGGFAVTNTAIGYLGFRGKFAPGEFDLPVGIDSCHLTSDPDGCGFDYCATIANTINSHPLRWPQGADPVTQLDFSSTPVQNACWTNYSGVSASVNNPVLQGIVDAGNAGDVDAGDPVYLDNGDKDATLKYIRDTFYFGVNGNPPRGADRYTPNPAGSPGSAPAIDSWVVKLPVFECQTGVHCAGGSPQKIVGGVCFEIREILAPSGPYADTEKAIKGRFLCPDSGDDNERTLFNTYCRDPSDPNTGHQDPGGCGDFGLRADKVVLVE